MISSSPLRPPSPLRKNGRVAVLALSSPSSPERIEKAIARLEAGGTEVIRAANLFDRHDGYLAGSDEARTREVNRLFAANDVDAFLFARGGYGAMRILDAIDYAAFAANPRPIIGYSDLTALHQAIATRTGIGTFHGPMLNTDFHDGLSPRIEEWFWSLLAGESPRQYQLDSATVLAEGSASGILFGGCLSVTVALIGTPYDFWVDDGIWFWEDVSEPAYRIDRMLTHLRLSGRLKSLRGVMIGKLKECGGADTSELPRLISGFFQSSGIPVISDLPFGHFGENLLLPIGARVSIDTAARTLSIPDPAVTPAARGASR